MSQVNVNQPPDNAPPPASDGSGYGFIVGIIVAILVIVLILWLLVFNKPATAPDNTDGGATDGGATESLPAVPEPSGWRLVTVA